MSPLEPELPLLPLEPELPLLPLEPELPLLLPHALACAQLVAPLTQVRSASVQDEHADSQDGAGAPQMDAT